MSIASYLQPGQGAQPPPAGPGAVSKRPMSLPQPGAPMVPHGYGPSLPTPPGHPSAIPAGQPPAQQGPPQPQLSPNLLTNTDAGDPLTLMLAHQALEHGQNQPVHPFPIAPGNPAIPMSAATAAAPPRTPLEEYLTRVLGPLG